jgi:hypothetical protein
MSFGFLHPLQVSEGSGKILVTAVGDNSEWGKTISLVTSSGDEQTPLQVRGGKNVAAAATAGERQLAIRHSSAAHAKYSYAAAAAAADATAGEAAGNAAQQ